MCILHLHSEYTEVGEDTNATSVTGFENMSSDLWRDPATLNAVSPIVLSFNAQETLLSQR